MALQASVQPPNGSAIDGGPQSIEAVIERSSVVVPVANQIRPYCVMQAAQDRTAKYAAPR